MAGTSFASLPHSTNKENISILLSQKDLTMILVHKDSSTALALSAFLNVTQITQLLLQHKDATVAGNRSTEDQLCTTCKRGCVE